jgi:glycerophosphoryl diester phosphodiesterase
MTLSLLDPGRHLVIAHRGASADAPENTIEAIELAIEQGCDAFECDVRITSDGVPVLMHDPTLRRTTGHQGEARHLNLDEVQAVDAGSQYVDAVGGHPYRDQGIRVPTLREVLRSFAAMPLIIEIKDPAAQDAVAGLLLAEGAADRCVVASFKPHALEAFRKPPFLVGGDRREILKLYFKGRLGLPLTPRGLMFAIPDYWKGRVELPLPGVVQAANRMGSPVHVWTVDDPTRAQTLCHRGVSGILTNRPGEIRAALRSRGFLP